MDRQFVFWGVMLLAVIFGFGSPFATDQKWGNRLTLGGNLMLFILLGLLGWTVFGDPIK
jgi:hypothetical protein